MEQGQERYVTLDYFTRNNNEKYTDVSIEGSLIENIGLIGLEYEALLKSFLNRKKSNDKNIYYWRESPGELIDIKDDNINFKILDNCKRIQAIERRQGNMYDDQIVFYYNDEVISKLKNDQISWLILHEYLWSKLDNAQEIRDLNEILHKKDLYDVNTNNPVSYTHLKA